MVGLITVDCLHGWTAGKARLGVGNWIVGAVKRVDETDGPLTAHIELIKARGIQLYN